MPIINRIPISTDNDDEHHKPLVESQTKTDRKHDPARNYSILPIMSTVAVKREDGNRWTQGTIVGKGDHNHHDQFYIIGVTKTGKTITRNSEHMKTRTITAVQYL